MATTTTTTTTASPEEPSTPRRAIRVLDPLVVDQIAAGEVVERPASAVKELVENALDAGAQRVEVRLEGGGADLVRVADDGWGMAADELPLALRPHATSKISTPEDLSSIGTMGFRGEALASIASVSRLRLRSRPRGSAVAHELVVEGGRWGEVRPAGGGFGTVVEVANLFCNTPARRRFLRTAQTERQRCVEVARAIALARPGVGLVVREGDRVLLDVPPEQRPPDRIAGVLGSDLAKDLLVVDDAGGRGLSLGVSLWGMVARPHAARASAKWQWTVLNGRYVRDGAIAHALREAYRGLIEPGRHPPAVLLIDIDPARVDVNVHPAKAEVRLRDGGALHAAVLHAVGAALEAADLTASHDQVRPWRPYTPARRAPHEPHPLAPDAELTEGAIESIFARPGPAPAATSRPSASADSQDAGATQGQQPAEEASQQQTRQSGQQLAGQHPEQPRWQEHGQGHAHEQSTANASAQPHATPAVRVRDSYLVTRDDAGVVIIDQHALHERVMFEALRLRMERNGRLESQRLLTPAIAQCRDESAAEGHAALFDRLGIEAAPAGPGRVAVHAFPSLLLARGVEPAQFVADLLDDPPPTLAGGDGQGGGGPDLESALRDVLDMMACKAAVKAGEHLSDEALTHLLALRESVERSASCPHGRPTSVRLTIADLERMFQRR